MTTIKSGRLALRVSMLRQAEPTPEAAFIERMRARNYSRYTLRNYRLDLAGAARAMGCPLLEATPQAIEAYLDGLSRRGLRATTISRRLASLRAFYKDAVKHGAIAADPSASYVPPRAAKRLPVYLNDAQVAALLGALRSETVGDRREAAIIACLYYTGMRAGELVGLHVEDIQADRLRVFGKGAKERDIPVPAKLTPYLTAWLAVHPLGNGPLFVSLGPEAERLGYDSIRRIFHGVMARAGLAGRGFTPHKLRHTYATRLINRGVGIHVIQRLLGHTSIAVTQVYAHAEFGPTIAADIDRDL